jgi:hypothetical protein
MHMAGYVEKIAAHFDWISTTLRVVLHKWSHLGMDRALGIARSRGKTQVERGRHRVFSRMPQKRITYI